MGRAVQVQVGAMTFPSKGKLTEKCRNVLYRHKVGQRVSDPDDIQFLFALIERHNERDQKVGVGISHFSVGRAPDKGTTCFFLHRIDGTFTDFSFMTCVDGKGNFERDAKEAMRAAIRQQIDNFRSKSLSEGPVHCPYRGVLLTEDNADVDHAQPKSFEFLLSAFLANEGIQLREVAVTPPADNQFVTKLTNTEFTDRWQRYHRENAQLRMLSKGANLSEARTSRGIEPR